MATQNVTFDARYLKILELIDAAEAGLKVTQVEPHVFGAAEKMGQLVGHGLIENTINEEGEELNIYVITLKGQQVLTKAARKIGKAVAPQTALRGVSKPGKRGAPQKAQAPGIDED